MLIKLDYVRGVPGENFICPLCEKRKMCRVKSGALVCHYCRLAVAHIFSEIPLKGSYEDIVGEKCVDCGKMIKLRNGRSVKFELKEKKKC